MKNGEWVPLSIFLTKSLPLGRAYSKVEAAFSLACDYDKNNAVSESGLAKVWGWSRKKVRLFLKQMGVEILYSEQKRSPLGGQVGVQVRDKLGTSKGQVRFIDSRHLEPRRDKLGTSKGQARDKKGTTTIHPNPNPIKIKKEKDSSEPEKPLDSKPEKVPVLKIPLIKKDGEFSVFQEDVDQWQETFPGIDVLQTLREIRQWNLDKPKNRKTSCGIRIHISTWMKKDQNKARSTNNSQNKKVRFPH